MKAVSLFEAKTHLSSLVKAVMQGECMAITKHGQEVALLVPIKRIKHPDIAQVIREMELLSQEIGKTGMTLQEIQKMRKKGLK